MWEKLGSLVGRNGFLALFVRVDLAEVYTQELWYVEWYALDLAGCGGGRSFCDVPRERGCAAVYAKTHIACWEGALAARLVVTRVRGGRRGGGLN